jgi:hypothetical protein
MPDFKRELYLDEGMSRAGGADVGIYTGEVENPAHASDGGAGKDIAALITRKINPRLARRLNNRLRRL